MKKPHSFYYMNEINSQYFSACLETGFIDGHTISLTRALRKSILEDIIKYYSLHIENFPSLRSIEVFQSIMEIWLTTNYNMSQILFVILPIFYEPCNWLNIWKVFRGSNGYCLVSAQYLRWYWVPGYWHIGACLVNCQITMSLKTSGIAMHRR